VFGGKLILQVSLLVSQTPTYQQLALALPEKLKLILYGLFAVNCSIS
jgi:hypothetical protein